MYSEAMIKMRQISIPTPCNESWAAMTPADKGRFCASCQKNVIDFTRSSDREIAVAFRGGENICGKFLPSQLERELYIPKEKNKYWIAVSVAVVNIVGLFSHQANAQEPKHREKIFVVKPLVTPLAPAHDYTVKVVGRRIVNGAIGDEATACHWQV
jgi:hypothetical protein